MVELVDTQVLKICPCIGVRVRVSVGVHRVSVLLKTQIASLDKLVKSPDLESGVCLGSIPR